MAKLVVETFQVCLGTDEADPNPTIFARGILVESDALSVRDRLLALKNGGQLDDAIAPASLTFYVRTSPGNQTRPLVAQTLTEVQLALRAARFSVPLYVRTTDDANGNAQFLRVGTRPSGDL